MKAFRPSRDFTGLKERRIHAAKLFKKGETQAAVSRILHVSRQSASRWYEKWQSGGTRALNGAERAGRKPRLTTKQLNDLDATLRAGSKIQGFQSNLWTLPRIAQVIHRQTGVEYHPGHVWKILQRLGWTLQRPAKRAKERNDQAVQEWVANKWPAIKKKPEK